MTEYEYENSTLYVIGKETTIAHIEEIDDENVEEVAEDIADRYDML